MTLTAACALAEIKVDGTTYTTLKDAANAAHASGKPVIISGEATLNGGLDSGITVTFIGADSSATLDMGGRTEVRSAGSKLTFKNLNIKRYDGNYGGITELNSADYVNCRFTGQLFNYAVNATFTDCIFNQPNKDAYNIWTYAAGKATFKDCIFNAAGKFVLIYNEGIRGTDATFTDCAFIGNDKFTNTEKAALEVNGEYLTGNKMHNVVMNNCEIDCRIPAAFRDKKHADFNATTGKTSFKQTGNTLAHIDDACGHPRNNGVGAAAAPSLPQTGDNSSLMFWSSLMILCAACIVMMSKKPASN